MTARQDWLSIGPFDPRNIKAVICDAVRSVTADDDAEVVVDPPLIRRGVERC